MKQFKDYAHLYIGCEATTPNGVGQIHTAAISGIVAVEFRGAAKPYEAEKVKPHLRRLESMTEDQENYYDSRMDDAYISHDMEAIAIIINDLIAEGYDCHGLIDAGLAIDAATLDQEAGKDGH